MLVLTTYDTDSDTIAAIEAGATGYLLKDAPTETLVAAIRATAAGETVLSPAVAPADWPRTCGDGGGRRADLA